LSAHPSRSDRLSSARPLRESVCWRHRIPPGSPDRREAYPNAVQVHADDGVPRLPTGRQTGLTCLSCAACTHEGAQVPPGSFRPKPFRIPQSLPSPARNPSQLAHDETCHLLQDPGQFSSRPSALGRLIDERLAPPSNPRAVFLGRFFHASLRPPDRSEV